ncbi:hypothetical protein [Candidatus Phyllobacterium onerii]|uniref:hypothetical protein n=1 Tax=Candidatus Phyllobacterium onerii TaxID=3020828 RepID=UPI00232D9073|nr:hypothetical protein [Phyllobacterium sp. IY22]
MSARDTSLDTLLDLDGQTMFVGQTYWVKFAVKAVTVTPLRPHGLRYSLTLHGPGGERLVGFDNAHAISAVRAKPQVDAKVRPQAPFPDIEAV